MNIKLGHEFYSVGIYIDIVSEGKVKTSFTSHTIPYIKVRVDPFFRDLVQFTILLPLKDLSSVHNPYLLAMKNMITIRSRSFFFKAENWKYSWNIVIYAVICWKNNLKLQWSDLFPISSPQNVIGDQITIIYDFQNVI